MCSFLNVACTIQSNIISELITQELSSFFCSLSSCHCIYCIVYYYIMVLTYVNKVNNNKKTYKEAMNYLKMGNISNYSKKREIEYL